VIIRGERSLPADFNKHLLKMHEILERNRAFRKQHRLPPFVYEIENGEA